MSRERKTVQMTHAHNSRTMSVRISDSQVAPACLTTHDSRFTTHERSAHSDDSPTTHDSRAKHAAPPARQLGFWMCLALVVGNIIGSGVFLLPARSRPMDSTASSAGWSPRPAAMLLAYRVRTAGAGVPAGWRPYVYPRVAFGELAGFLMAWGYWMSVWVGNAAIAIATVAYLAELVPVLKHDARRAGRYCCARIIWMLTFLNWRGVQETGVVQIVTTVLKMLPLLAVIVLALILLASRTPRSIKMESQPFSRPRDRRIGDADVMGAARPRVGHRARRKRHRSGAHHSAGDAVGHADAAVSFISLACSIVVLLIPASNSRESNAPFADACALFWGDRAARRWRCSPSSAASARSTAGFSCRARCLVCWRAKASFRKSSRMNRRTARPAQRCSSPVRLLTCWC